MGYMLEDTKRDLLNYARMLPEVEVNGIKTRKYEEYDINVLADEYCKAKDEGNNHNRDIYFAALMLRFWYVINKIYQQVSYYGYDYLDCFNRLYYCIEVACKYRAWQNPDKHTNAQACINMAIRDRGAAMMAYEAKLQKHGPINTYSLDETLDDESMTTRADMLVDNSYEEREQEDNAIDMIQSLISRNKIIEAIIADNIAFKDTRKHEKKIVKEIDEDGNEYKYTQCSSQFWPFKLVQELNALDDAYYAYFLRTYRINIEKLSAAREALEKANNQKKYKLLDASLATMRELYAAGQL